MSLKDREVRNEYMREYRKKRRVSDPEWREKMNRESSRYSKSRLQDDPVFALRKRDICRRWYTEHKDTPEHKADSIRRAAKKRGLEFSLPSALAVDLVSDVCFYCGMKPDPTNGIDRVDSSRGYLLDNVVTCCLRCNMAKSDGSRSSFESWVGRVYEHQNRYASA